MSAVPLPRDAAERLERLRGRFSLSDEATEALTRLVLLLADDPHAPTTVVDPAAAIDAHVADALVALELREVREARTVADLGSGAGFPGLILAIARPDAVVSLVESVGRKCAFLERAIEEAEITNAVVVNERAESWPAGIAVHDLVTARALAPLNIVAEYAAPLLRVGGGLVAWTGRREATAEADAGRAAQILGLSAPEPIPVMPFAQAEHRHLVLMTKLRETPAAYPRRTGVARKRPLGLVDRSSDRPRR